MEKKLLELTAEYVAVKDSIDNDHYAGESHRPRTLDQIAEEFGGVLREFLADS